MPDSPPGQPAPVSREPRLGDSGPRCRGKGLPCCFNQERETRMGKRFLTVVLTLWVASALMLPVQAKTGHHGRMKQYASEHGARMHRHGTRRPKQRHARMQRYSAEHRARQHRHRAHMKAHH